MISVCSFLGRTPTLFAITLQGRIAGRRVDPLFLDPSLRQWLAGIDSGPKVVQKRICALQLLERQRQWCSDRGVPCRAELYEEGRWPERVMQSARRSRVDLILVGLQAMASADQVTPHDMELLARDAPCPVSIVRLPALTAF